MLLEKIKKFKTAKLISDFLSFVCIIAFLIFMMFFIFKIVFYTNNFLLCFIYTASFILISCWGFAKIINYIYDLKILNFNKYFNKEEVINNLNLFKKNNINNEFLSFFKENNDLIQCNIKVITENINNREWIIKLDLDTEQKKILLLNKDLDWYSRQVSTRELYLYLESAITDIIEKEESKYYIVLINLFSDFISEKYLQKMKNKINLEQKTLIINI